jgi:hypothetical protein
MPPRLETCRRCRGSARRAARDRGWAPLATARAGPMPEKAPIMTVLSHRPSPSEPRRRSSCSHSMVGTSRREHHEQGTGDFRTVGWVDRVPRWRRFRNRRK